MSIHDADTSDAAETPSTPDGAVAVAERLRRPWPRSCVGAIRWAAYVLGSWLVLRPALLTTVYADDFVNPFTQFPVTHLDLGEMIRFGWNGARSAGHINVVGQAIGAMVTSAWMFAMGTLGLRYSTIYAATKLAVYVFTAVAAAGFAREVLALAGRTVGAWRSRVLVAVALFGTLQIHIVWSNDPVTSYPMSGFITAGFGFLLLVHALRALVRESPRRQWLVAAGGSVAVLYYEILVAAVGAILFIIAWDLWMRRRAGRSAWLGAARSAAIMVAIPVAVAVVAKKTIGATNSGYTGTTLSLGADFLKSLFNGLVSTLPAAGWQLSREFLDGPIHLRSTALAIVALVGAVLAILGVRHPTPVSPGGTRWQHVTLLSAPLAFMFGSAVVQTATEKVQQEAPRIGYVYNYYAMGATAWSVVFVVIGCCIPWDRLALWLRATVGVGVLAFLAVQFFVNWDVSVKFNDATYPSRQLLVTFSEERPKEERCSALYGWALGAWPDYYEDSMIAGLQDAYQYFHDEPFCDGFVRPN